MPSRAPALAISWVNSRSSGLGPGSTDGWTTLVAGPATTSSSPVHTTSTQPSGSTGPGGPDRVQTHATYGSRPAGAGISRYTTGGLLRYSRLAVSVAFVVFLLLSTAFRFTWYVPPASFCALNLSL